MCVESLVQKSREAGALQGFALSLFLPDLFSSWKLSRGWKEWRLGWPGGLGREEAENTFQILIKSLFVVCSLQPACLFSLPLSLSPPSLFISCLSLTPVFFVSNLSFQLFHFLTTLCQYLCLSISPCPSPSVCLSWSVCAWVSLSICSITHLSGCLCSSF